jgi:hypothetical protein
MVSSIGSSQLYSLAPSVVGKNEWEFLARDEIFAESL